MRALVKKEELEFAPIHIASVIGDVVQLVHSDEIFITFTSSSNAKMACLMCEATECNCNRLFSIF